MVWTPFVGVHIRNSGLSVHQGQVQLVLLIRLLLVISLSFLFLLCGALLGLSSLLLLSSLHLSLASSLAPPFAGANLAPTPPSGRTPCLLRGGSGTSSSR